MIKLKLLPILISSCFFIGCGSVTSHYRQVEDHYKTGRFKEAGQVIEANREGYGDRNAVLYYMDKGMTAHLAGELKKSNEYLTLAEDTIESLYRKSIARGLGSMLTNENIYPYEGEDFEKVMLNIIMALNYIYLGQPGEALVEARKVDHKLNVLNDKYEEKDVYKEDVLARYLSGILYEAQGEINDALIEYRKAYEIGQTYRKDYDTPIPPYLNKDLLRITEALHFNEEFQKYKNKFSGTKWESLKSLRKKGELIVLIFNGQAPIKEDYFIDAIIPEGKEWEGEIVRVAFPKFVPRDPAADYFNINLGNKAGSHRTYLIEDITAIARKNLADRISRIRIKAIARAITKYIAGRKLRNEAKKSGNFIVSGLTWLGTNVYAVASEQSDKRSWRTLPAQIQISRIVLDPGEYHITITPMRDNTPAGQERVFDAFIKAKEKKFIVVYNY